MTAQPFSGWRFDHWEGDASGTANPLTVTASGNTTVIGVFVEVPVAVAIEKFEAEPADGGVTLRWSVGDASQVARADVERAIAEAGPWSAVAGEPSLADGAYTLLDASAEPGVAYWYRLVVTARDGSRAVAGPVRVAAAAHAWTTQLAPLAPNPTALPLRVAFTLARESRVSLALFDVLGRRVATLADGALPAGPHSVAWSGAGGRLPAGLYLVRLTTPERTFTRRVAIVR